LSCGIGEGDDLGDRRMVHQDLVDLERADLLAAAVDDSFRRPVMEQIAVGVDQRALVAGAEPAVGEGLGLASGLAS
jgi:hypothetical protein